MQELVAKFLAFEEIKRTYPSVVGTPAGSLLQTHQSTKANLHVDAALVCGNHVLDVDKGIVPSLGFEQLQCFHDQLP